MNTVDAVVAAIEGEWAIVTVKRSAGCGRCQEPGGCGGSLNPDLLDQGTSSCGGRQYRVLNDIGARLGDTVALSVPEGLVLRAAMASYGVSVLLAILGAALATALDAGEGGAILGAVTGLLVGYGFLRSGRSAWAKQGGRGLSIHFK